MGGVRTRSSPVPAQDTPDVRLLVLAAGTAGCAGVDLASGALVRAQFQERTREALRPYDVVEAQRVDDDRAVFAADSVVVAGAPRRTGRLRGRRAERFLRPLLHPPTEHLLGSAGATVPFWTLRHDQPSVALVTPQADPVVERGADGLRCRFRWRRLEYVLPLDDPHMAAAITHPAATRLSARTLARALGWRPHRLVVALTPPHEGHCYKVVAAVLPRP